MVRRVRGHVVPKYIGGRPTAGRAVQKIGIAATLVAAGFVVPVVVGNASVMSLMATGYCYGIAAAGLVLLFGCAGVLNMAQGAVMGIGGYIAAEVVVHLHVGFWLALVLAVFGATIVSTAIGAVATRVRGHYFTIFSFALAVGVRQVILNWSSVTGGPTGVVLAVPGRVFGVSLASSQGLLGVSFLIAMVIFAVVRWLVHARIGRQARAVRENEDLSEAVGIWASGVRGVLFVVAGAFGGLGGMLLVISQGYARPSDAGGQAGLMLVLFLLLGGAATGIGPFVGAVLYWLLSGLLGLSGNWDEVVIGIVFIVVILLLPEGIFPGVVQVGRKLSDRLRRISGCGGQLVEGERGSWQTMPAEQNRPVVSVAGRAAVPRVKGWERSSEGTRDRGAFLEVKAATKSFGGVPALCSVDFTVERGELVGLIGPNGSGKTTLINCIGGRLTMDGGEVLLGGEDITHWTPHRRARAGLVRTFQDAVWLGGMRLHDAIDMVLEGSARRAPDGKFPYVGPRWQEWEGYVLGGLAGYGGAISDLPVGLQQRAALALAVAARPSVLFLDEPGGGLGEDDLGQLEELLKALAGAGVGVVVVDHNVPFVTSTCSRVVVLDAGLCIYDGSAEAAVQSPAVQEAYLGAPV